MKTYLRFLTISLLFCLLATTSYGQGYWRIIAPPLPPSSTIWALHAHTDSILIMQASPISGNAKLLRSADGGNTWTDQAPQMNPQIPLFNAFSLTSVGDTLVMSVGNLVYKSFDTGLTWAETGAPAFNGGGGVSLGLSGVGYSSAPGGGNSYYFTTDGWRTYTGQATPYFNQHSYGIPMIVGQGDTVIMPSSQSKPIIAVQMAVSFDRGQNWILPAGLPTAGSLGGHKSFYGTTCYITGRDSGIAGTTPPRLYKSIDAGASWSNILPVVRVRLGRF